MKKKKAEQQSGDKINSQPIPVEHIKKLFYQQSTFKYLMLLISLSSLTWFGGYWNDSATMPESGLALELEDINVLFVLLMGIYAISRSKALMIPSIIMAVIANALTWSAEVTDNYALTVAGGTAITLFFAYTACIILFDLGRTEKITHDTIIGSLCAYALFGIAFGLLYSVIELLQPGSFVSSTAAVGEAAIKQRDYPTLIYYSFITLSSVGYGDIVPVKPAAKMVAWSEGIFGQFYMAVLVARLVAKHLEQARLKRERAR